MTRIISSLAEVSASYDALFCDLWGCLHNGKQPFPAAVAALQAFRAQGGQVCLMTNAPRPNQYVIAQLDRMGVRRLRGGPGKLASNRRARLVEHAVFSRLVSSEDLALLDQAHDDDED